MRRSSIKWRWCLTRYTEGFRSLLLKAVQRMSQAVHRMSQAVRPKTSRYLGTWKLHCYISVFRLIDLEPGILTIDFFWLGQIGYGALLVGSLLCLLLFVVCNLLLNQCYLCYLNFSFVLVSWTKLFICIVTRVLCIE